MKIWFKFGGWGESQAALRVRCGRRCEFVHEFELGGLVVACVCVCVCVCAWGRSSRYSYARRN